MTEYQKERVNKMMRSEWETYRRHADVLEDAMCCLAEAERHDRVMSEALARLNGMRETLEILGYSIRYEDHSIPQVC